MNNRTKLEEHTVNHHVIAFAGDMNPAKALPWPKATPSEVKLWLIKQRTAALRNKR